MFHFPWASYQYLCILSSQPNNGAGNGRQKAKSRMTTAAVKTKAEPKAQRTAETQKNWRHSLTGASGPGPVVPKGGQKPNVGDRLLVPPGEELLQGESGAARLGSSGMVQGQGPTPTAICRAEGRSGKGKKSVWMTQIPKCGAQLKASEAGS